MNAFENYFHSLQGKKIAVLGLGVSNRPLVRLLLEYGCQVMGCDKTPREKLDEEVLTLEAAGCRLCVGEGYLDGVSADVVFRTPGMHPNVPAICRLREQGVQVEMFDTSVTPASYILAAAFRFSHVVLAAPTYNGGVFVTMENLLHDLTAHGLKGRRAAYIENGSWAPTSARGMQKLLEPLNWETAADTVTLRSALRQGQQEDLERMAAQLAESVKA